MDETPRPTPSPTPGARFVLRLDPGEVVELVHPERFRDLPDRSLRRRWRKSPRDLLLWPGLRTTTVSSESGEVLLKSDLSASAVAQIDLGPDEEFVVRSGNLLCLSRALTRRFVRPQWAEAYFLKMLNLRVRGPGKLVLFCRSGIELAPLPNEGRAVAPPDLLGYDAGVRVGIGTREDSLFRAATSPEDFLLSGVGRYVTSSHHLSGDNGPPPDTLAGWVIEVVDHNSPIPIKKLLGRR
jgi:hypothetical protein